MALTNDLLNANAATAGLTDEQKAAIVEMSKNDETAVIGQKTGEIYGGLDADILAASGIAKNGAEKTYDYAKRVIGEIKGQAGNATQLQTQIAELTKEKARLEKVIAEGGADAETKKALTQAKADLANVTKEYTDLKAEFDTAKQNHANELLNVRMDGEFAKASAGMKFKADLPQSVISVLLNQAIAKVKGMAPEFIDDGTGTGTKVLAFKDSTGAIMRNPETNLNPYTAADLLKKELQTMGVLDNGRQQQGAGSSGGSGSGSGSGNGGSVDVSGARTQSEASEMIAKGLMAQGLTIGSPEYQTKFSEAWKNNIATIKALPVQ